MKATKEVIVKKTLIEQFKEVPDYRVKRTKKYELFEIIMMAICATIAGANDWTDVANWAKVNGPWLQRFISLKNGTPSHDTFSRVFARIDPEGFMRCFVSWTSEISGLIGGKVVAIDGKTLRGSYDRSLNKSAIHMVSAWVAETQISLGQVKTAEKSNEITAIPELLDMLDVKGCIITLDAMGCQKNIAKKTIDKSADYMLALKKNQKELYELVSFFFEDAKSNEYKELKHSKFTTIEKNHGRIEKRMVTATDKIESLISKHEWAGIKSIVRVDAERIINNETAASTRYYITSLPSDAEKIAHVIRSHWSIESTLHWSLDVTFNEDKSRVRKNNGPENLALLKRLTFNLLKRDTESKHSVKSKRFIASFDSTYLEKVLMI